MKFMEWMTFMTKSTLQRNILLAQILISTFIIGAIVYYVYPFIEKNNALIGAYYGITTALSFALCIFIEYIMNIIYECMKARAAKKAANSNPTEEHAEFTKQLKVEMQNKEINNYRKKYHD